MTHSTKYNARDVIGRFLSSQFLRDLKQVGDATLDLIFPPRCLHCGRVDTWWCDVCEIKLKSVPIVSIPVTIAGINSTLATTEHESICQEALQALKYQGRVELAPLLGQRLVEILSVASWTFDIIIPVPIHTIRIRERGYNQSKLLSEAIHQHFGVAIAEDALLKAHLTRPQVGLGREERLANVRGSFIANSDQISGRSVLLVDDVLTTGATLRECAETLRTNGATDVYAVSVSYAVSS